MDQPNTPAPEGELWALAGIANIIHWFEELLSILNGPLLMAGAGIAIVDLLTDGSLTTHAIVFLWIWAVSQALGIDIQLLGAFARARRAFQCGHIRHMLGWLGLGLLLGLAAWQAGYVYAVEQSEHISEAAALAQLNMPAWLWLGERAFLAVGLVALSGWTRYQKPSAGDNLLTKRAELEEQLTLAPLQAQLTAMRAAGWRNAARAAIRGDVPERQPEQHDPEPPEPPTPPDPAPSRRDEPEGQEEDTDGMSFTPGLMRVVPRRAAGSRNDLRNKTRMNREDQLMVQARALLDASPEMTRKDLRTALHCRQETANALYTSWQLRRERRARG